MRDEHHQSSLLSNARNLAEHHSFLTIAVALVGYVMVKPPIRVVSIIARGKQGFTRVLVDHSPQITRWSFRILLLCLLLHIGYAIIGTAVFGDDAYSHLSWLEDFAKLRAAGINYPRWLPDTFGQLGSPAFYFYPPLCYFIGSFFSSVGIAHDGPSLFHIINVAGLLLSGATSYRYLRQRQLLEHYALIGALLYMTASYRYVDTYTRAALTEHVAFAWIPLILIAIDKALQQQNMRAFLLSTIGWSLLILTNIPTLVVTALLAFSYGIGEAGRSIVRLWPILAGGTLAALICGIYIVPIASLHPFIQVDSLWYSESYSSRWHHFFVELLNEMSKKNAVKFSALVSFLLTLCILFLLHRWRRPSQPRSGLIAMAWCCVFLQLPFISDPIWDLLSPLHLIQFSWRLSIGLVLVTAVTLAISLQHRQHAASIVVLAAACVSLFFYVRFAYIVLTFPPAPNRVEPIRAGPPEYVNRFINQPADSLESFAQQLLDSPLFVSDKHISISYVAQSANSISAVISSAEPFDLRIKKLWWPLWQLKSNDNHNFALRPDSNGLIVARSIPAGQHSIHLSMQESNAERDGKRISTIGILIFTLLCLVGWRIHRKKSMQCVNR